MRKNLVTTVGNITLDVILYTQQGRVVNTPRNFLSQKLLAFEYGAKTECRELYTTVGGAAANAAVTFTRMGLGPTIVGAIGDDTIGSMCLEHLKAEHIKTSMVQHIHGATTSTSIIVNSGKKRDHVIFVYRGAARGLTLSPALVRKITSAWVYMGSLTAKWRTDVQNIFSNAAKHSTAVAWNPGIEQLSAGARVLRPWLTATTVLIVNQDEARELLTRSGVNVRAASPRALVKCLHTYGQKMSLLTMGHRGAFLQIGSQLLFQPAKKVSFVNKTGAGDAFGSGFVAGMILFKDERRALKLAVSNSASVVQHIGAHSGILYRRDIKRFDI